MKSKIQLLHLLLFVILISSTQVCVGQAYFKVGINASQMTQHPKSFDANLGGGLTAGLGGLIPISRNNDFFLRTEILYSQKGCDPKHIDRNQRITLNYVAIPVLFSYHITNSIGVDLGVEYALFLSQKETKIQGNFNKSDLGISVGGTFFRDRRRRTCYSVRYTHGLLNVYNGDFVMSYGEISNVKFQNYAIQLAAHIKLKN